MDEEDNWLDSGWCLALVIVAALLVLLWGLATYYHS